MNLDRAFNRVVFPLPVPPEMTIFMRAFTHAERKSSISEAIESFARRSSTVSGRDPKRRIDTSGPFSAGRIEDGVQAAAVG